MAGFGFTAPVFYGGVVVLVFGLAAYGGSKISFQSGSVEPGEDSAGRKRVGVVGGLLGTILIVVGLLLTPSGSGDSTSGPGTSSMSTSPAIEPVPDEGITVDSPMSADQIEADCNETTCWVWASGRLGAAVGPELHPYALVAFAGDGGGNGSYWVQYDSTERESDTWSAQLYVDPESSGAAMIKAVLLSDPVLLPEDTSQGLTYDEALAQGATVVAESDPIQVVINTR